MHAFLFYNKDFNMYRTYIVLKLVTKLYQDFLQPAIKCITNAYLKQTTPYILCEQHCSLQIFILKTFAPTPEQVNLIKNL